MAENGVVLTPAQQRSIVALLSARSVREAATVANVPERTLTRWLREDTFVTALRAAEEALLDAATRRLLAMQSDALDTLERLLQDADVTAGVQLRAALGIMSHVLHLREVRDIEARLSALEAAQHEQTR